MLDDTKQKPKWLVVGLLAIAAPVAGLWYWLSRPNASSLIETSVQTASNSLDQSLLLMATDSADDDDDDDDEENLLLLWQAFGNAEITVAVDKETSDGNEGSGPSSNDDGGDDPDDDDDEDLSLADAEALVANARVLSRLLPDVLRPELASDPRVRQMVQSAQEMLKRRGVSVDNDLLVGQNVDELSESEKVSIARAAESQIAEIACRFELAAIDQALESLTRSEAHFRVIQKDLRTLLPESSLVPEDPLAFAPKETLLKAKNGLQSQQFQLKRKLAILGVGSDSVEFQSGKIYSLIDKFIARIQDILESEGHAKFQAERLIEYKKISKKKWDETVKAQPQRVATEEASLLKILHAEVGWPELRIGSTSIRGPPAGTLDSVVWTAIRDFDTNVRRWLKAESCIRALGDELLTVPEVRELLPESIDSRYERVAVLLDETTLRNGLVLADSVVSQTSNVVEEEIFPGRRKHFEEIQSAFRNEIARRRSGGTVLADTEKLSPLVKIYTDLYQPPARAEARMLSLAANRFPKLTLLPTNIRSDIKNVQAKAIGRYADRITTLIGGYQEIANYLALATDSAPELLEKLQGARAELHAINSEFAEMVEVAKKYETDVAPAKAVLVQLECLFPRGPPEDNPPPSVQPRPDKPLPSGGGNGMVVNASGIKRVLTDITPTTSTNPSLEKYLVLSSARLSNAEAIVQSTLREASSLDAQPVKFATAPGRRVLDPTKVARDAKGEIDFLSIKPDETVTRLSKSLEDWEGRLKDVNRGPRTSKVPYDHQTEVKNPKSFKGIGGGVHFGEIATTDVDLSKHTFALRYESGILFLHDGVSGKRYNVASPEEIDSTSLKALYRFAKQNRNAAISIGWASGSTISGSESAGMPILLDPYLVDTAVGQDLILADSIPWSFDEEKLPNDAPIAFHAEFKRNVEAYKTNRLTTFRDIFAGVEPYRDSEKRAWTNRLKADLQLVQAARSEWVESQLEAITESSEDELQRAREVLAAEPARVRQFFSEQFDSSISTLTDSSKGYDRESIKIVNSLVRVLLKQGECPKSLIRLWGSLIASDLSQKPIPVDELPSAFSEVLKLLTESTTLAVLYDTSGSFELREGALVSAIQMEYLYATLNFRVTDTSIEIGEDESRDQKVKKLNELTRLANENLDAVSQAYPPLRRVVERAGLTAFFKWAISKQMEGVLLIDLSELAAVPANDPVRYPTPDWRK